MKTVVRNLEKNASYLEIFFCRNGGERVRMSSIEFIRGCVDVLRGKFYPRSRITGKFAYIVLIACQNVLY